MARQPRDLVVRFLSDVRGFLSGTDKMEEALRDVARDEEKLADAGEDSARRIARAYDRAADQVVRDQRKAHRDVREGFADTGREAGQEFTQNLGEAVSSGDLSGLLGDTAGGLAATFGASGKVGAAFAGLAVAASVAWAQIQADAEKTKQLALDTFEDLLSRADYESRLRTALTNQYGSFMEGLEKIGRMSDATGIDVGRIRDAFANGGDEARKLADEVDRIADRLPRGNAMRVTNQGDVTAARNLAEDLERAAAATERAARAEQLRGEKLAVSASYYAQAYGVGSGQGIPAYATGKRG